MTSNGKTEPAWFPELADALLEHCRERSYELHDRGYEGYGRTWDIEVPNREGRVRLSYGLEMFLLDFPGGFGWNEIADFTSDDHHEALRALLQLLDSYADPGTRLVAVQRRWRRLRLELHFTDGTVLWSRGGQRPRS